jgi:hypothetical protein
MSSEFGSRKRPTQSGAVPQKEDFFHIFRTKSETVPHFRDHVVKKRNSSMKCGPGIESGSRFNKIWPIIQEDRHNVEQFHKKGSAVPQNVEQHSHFGSYVVDYPNLAHYPRRPTKCGAVPQKGELYHIIRIKSGTVPQF